RRTGPAYPRASPGPHPFDTGPARRQGARRRVDWLGDQFAGRVWERRPFLLSSSWGPTAPPPLWRRNPIILHAVNFNSRRGSIGRWTLVDHQNVVTKALASSLNQTRRRQKIDNRPIRTGGDSAFTNIHWRAEQG